MEIAFGVISIVALIFFIIVILDRVFFIKKVKTIQTGDTGAIIKEKTKLKLVIDKIEKNNYEAHIYSKLTIFHYKLIFQNGRLISKVEE